MLTGKCKTDFDKWLLDNFKIYGVTPENCETHSGEWIDIICHYSIYVDFFDSVDVFITDLCYERPDGDFYYSWEIVGVFGNIYNEKIIKTRQEAREQAILKANEIYN